MHSSPPPLISSCMERSIPNVYSKLGSPVVSAEMGGWRGTEMGHFPTIGVNKHSQGTDKRDFSLLMAEETRVDRTPWKDWLFSGLERSVWSHKEECDERRQAAERTRRATHSCTHSFLSGCKVKICMCLFFFYFTPSFLLFSIDEKLEYHTLY